MMLKFSVIISTIFLTETPKDLMAGLDEEHVGSQKSVKFRPVVQNDSHAGKRVSICLEWPEAYAAMREKEPSALPIWTRVPTPRYEVSPHVQEYMNRRDELRVNQNHKHKVRERIDRILKEVRGVLPFRKTSDTRHKIKTTEQL